jgi:EpsI family protein
MNLKNSLIAAAVMMLTSICIPYLTHSDDQSLKRSLSEFPLQIGDWHGTIGLFDEKVYKVLGVDDSILVNYHKPLRDGIQLYIGFYKSQREGELIHSPKNCMPGSGWTIADVSLVKLNLKKSKGEPIKVIQLIMHKGSQRQVAIYWFHSRGRVISSEYFQKIYLVWDSITRHRTDGSFIRLLSLTTASDQTQTTQDLKRFAEQILPILDEYIPS